MGNVHMEATQINYRGGSKKMSVEEAIKAAGTEITPEEKTWIDSIPALTTSNAGKTDQDVIAPEFDAESGIYAIGDLVMHEGKLYEFTSAHETAGDWDSSEVSETTVADELNSLESGLTNLSNVVNGEYHTIQGSSSVDIPITGGVYRFITGRDSNKFLTCGLITYNWNGTPDVALLYSPSDSLITVTAGAGKVTFANAAQSSYCNLVLYKIF